MAKRNLKKVSFAKPQIVKKTVNVKGIEPFDIEIDTSKLGLASLDLGMALFDGDKIRASDMVYFVSQALSGWSLEAELTLENIRCIKPSSALVKMFEVISIEMHKVKN